MLIPAIDLKGGKVVQLIQGEKLAIETSDLDYGSSVSPVSPRQRHRPRRRHELGSNDHLFARSARDCPARSRRRPSPERAAELCTIGAKKVIVGSALFSDGVATKRARSDSPTPSALIACRCGRQQSGSCRHTRVEDVDRDDGRHCGAGARTLLRRVPVHARR